MSVIKGFYQGFAFLFQGFSLIFQQGIRRFVLIPLLINIVIFSGAVWLAYAQYQSLMDQLLGSLPSWLSWIEWLLLPLFGLLVSLIIYYTFIKIINCFFSCAAIRIGFIYKVTLWVTTTHYYIIYNYFFLKENKCYFMIFNKLYLINYIIII